MSNNDIDFCYLGHQVHVHREPCPGGWLGDPNTMLQVAIDGVPVHVPGIWSAYYSDGDKGIELLIKALLKRTVEMSG